MRQIVDTVRAKIRLARSWRQISRRIFRTGRRGETKKTEFGVFRVKHSCGHLERARTDDQRGRILRIQRGIFRECRISAIHTRRIRRLADKSKRRAAGASSTCPGTLVPMRRQRDNVLFRFGAHATPTSPAPAETTIRRPCSLSCVSIQFRK